jgi:hypothetical protein
MIIHHETQRDRGAQEPKKSLTTTLGIFLRVDSVFYPILIGKRSTDYPKS